MRPCLTSSLVEISVLVDNTVGASRPKGLCAEWGFAAAVDGVLFDAGQSECARHNAELLGVGPDFETIVCSHSHYDHTSGLRAFLDPDDPPTLYCHPSVWEQRFQVDDEDPSAQPEPIGLELDREEVERGAEVVEHTEPVEVAHGIHALGEIPRPHPDAAIGKVERDGELVDDPVPDDQSLAIETDDGVALVMGCGHAGLRNTIEHAESVTGGTVRHVVGGTHLVAMDVEGVHEIADWLDGRLETFAGCHCTGFEAQTVFAERLPEAFVSVGAGSVLSIGD